MNINETNVCRRCLNRSMSLKWTRLDRFIQDILKTMPKDQILSIINHLFESITLALTSDTRLGRAAAMSC